jgi:hypothetical protein
MKEPTCSPRGCKSQLGSMQQKMDAGFKDATQQMGSMQQQISGVQQQMGGIQLEFGGVQQQMGGIQLEVGGVQQQMGGIQLEVGVCKLVGVAPSEAATTLVVRAACAAALREVRPSRALAQRGVRAAWH